MNNKITFPELVDRIAEITKTSKRVSELFLKELFGVIKERLEQGETVKIKNLGTFKVIEIATRKSVNVNTGEEMEIPSHRRVSFTPDKSLAEAVNTPFEGFETIVLDDDIKEEELNENEELGILHAESSVSEQCESAKDWRTEARLTSIRNEELNDNEELPPVFVEKIADIPAETVEHKVVAEEESIEHDVVDDSVSEQDKKGEITQEVKMSEKEAVVDEKICDDEDYEEEVRTEKRKSFIWGFIGGIVTFIIIGFISIAVCDSCFGDFVPYSDEKEMLTEVSSMEVVMDTKKEVPDTAKQKEIEPIEEKSVLLTDTVRVNYYLTKMSRKYYGRYEFWVYIYEENKDKIKNPNRVPPGLVVVIPPAEKYGIDKNDVESVEKAKKLAEKI